MWLNLSMFSPLTEVLSVSTDSELRFMLTDTVSLLLSFRVLSLGEPCGVAMGVPMGVAAVCVIIGGLSGPSTDVCCSRVLLCWVRLSSFVPVMDTGGGRASIFFSEACV